VTEQRRAERALQAHYAVSRALRDWETFDEGVTVLLRRLGTALDLPMGSLWTCDREEGRLRCRAFWHAPDVNTGEFEPLTRDATFAVGQGVPGAVWQSGRPEIVPDAHEQFDFKRRQAAAALGLRSGLAIPAVADGHTLAVLSYYSFDRHPPSDLVMRTLTGIGAEIGRFLSRRRANLQPSALSPRELEVLGLAAAGNSGPEIAVLLMLSPGTVKTHFANIYEKLGVGDRAAAVAHALRTGLID
jgi:DNA-binding CsgD family transcriptional regulator